MLCQSLTKKKKPCKFKSKPGNRYCGHHIANPKRYYYRCHQPSTIHLDDEILLNKCPICLMSLTENINTLKLDNCGHIFCEKRIQKWKSYNKNTCPCCRTIITSDFINDSDSDSDDSEFIIILNQVKIHICKSLPYVISLIIYKNIKLIVCFFYVV